MKETISKQYFADKQNMSHDLVGFFKQEILSGRLNPGDRIVETKFARELGISQTPVREAVRQLSGEGIVTIVPNRGPVVNELQTRDIFEIYSLRASIEGLAIRIATQVVRDDEIEALERFYDEMRRKADDDNVSSLLEDSVFIHQSIITLSAHSRLIHAYESNSFQIALVNRILGKESTKQKEVEQHSELIEALKERSPDKAELTMRKHIYRSYRECLDLKDEEDSESGTDLWF
ncbi:GntR family transcriptional regulator [Paenibacillus mendelii]|uniref:GntR family transcriptional regulator n=1 Tax=Paenibacillus mendelii TaxID=206163 RepID=A0ABV6JHH1_9BACL|nr:GntR family transcriptional regulator [Paenibacillus mendelii]MCQ6558132.1 GntR family transcriptional regulator [Paenibacillus mendelii]